MSKRATALRKLPRNNLPYGIYKYKVGFNHDSHNRYAAGNLKTFGQEILDYVKSNVRGKYKCMVTNNSLTSLYLTDMSDLMILKMMFSQHIFKTYQIELIN